ncbi:MAG: cytochrome b/b6 domain-containing protein [Dehalococcoidia bacterium]
MTRLPDTTAESDAMVRRFEVPTRLVHWLLAAPFVLLLLTGLTNFEPGLKATQVGGVRVFAWLHVVIGFAALGGAVLALLQLSRRSARTDLEALADVSLDDYLWFQHEAITLAGGRSIGPRVGKFNAGQKVNAVVSAGATVALLGTGIVLGINYVSKSVFDASFVESVFPWHTTIALLFIPVLLGHLYLAVLNPSTRESLQGITRGIVRRDWARRHHPAWLDDLEG